MPSFRERISQAAFREGSLLDRVFGNKKERALAPPSASWYASTGIPANWKPSESLEAYDYNVCVYRCVLTIAMEMAGVPLRLRFTNERGDVSYVDRHQAIETMRRPEETKTGKCQLSGMTLRIVTGMHLMLSGRASGYLTKGSRANTEEPRPISICPYHSRSERSSTATNQNCDLRQHRDSPAEELWERDLGLRSESF